MSDLLRQVDARTKLAGNNKLEILLFSLGADRTSGRKESYGINVFKVREVMRTPAITRAPDMPPSFKAWSVCVANWFRSWISPSTPASTSRVPPRS